MSLKSVVLQGSTHSIRVLCYKGADDWDLMSYAGFAGTIMGDMVLFVLCSGCVVATTDELPPLERHLLR